MTEDGPASGERLAQIVGRLRSAGGRVTIARRAVVEALVGAGTHHTADDIAAIVQARHPEVHRSTIYRTLEVLERLDVVRHVHLGHGRAVFHLADELHHHLVCDECGAVVEAPDELFRPLLDELRASFGFEARPHHFAVAGRCARCR